MNRSLSFYRNAARIEESMMRAAMPRAAANDPAPLLSYGALPKGAANARRADRPVAPLMVRMMEVARGN